MPPAAPTCHSAPVFPVHYDSGFQPAFYRPPPAESVFSPPDAARDRVRTSYRADIHGTHADFCRHGDFARYRGEVIDNLDFLRDFCKRHRMSDAQAIANGFDVFRKHRFEESYFEGQLELVDSVGKQSLDNFCDMIRDERIDLDKRKAAVRNLSHGVSVCASGSTSNLIAADRALALSADGIRATLWRMKEETVRNVLQQAVAQQFGLTAAYTGSEIHYVNAVWNYIADSFGLETIPDAMAPTLQFGFLDACRERARAAITADQLARRIAEQYLGLFASQATARSLPPSGDMTAAVNTSLTDILEDIHQRHGLDEDALSLHGFVRLDDDGVRYALRADPSLIARELLKVMHDQHLLTVMPTFEGRWKGRDGAWCALYVFGKDLAWMARLSGPWVRANDWGGGPGADLVTVPDLVAWQAARPQGRSQPPATALRQAIRCSAAGELAGLPDAWLRGEEPLRELLARNAHEQVRRCLKTHFLYFVNELPRNDRAALADDLMGRGNTVLRLVRDWYPDPWTLLGEIRDVAQRRSRLQRWMAYGNAQAIEAILAADHGSRYLDAGRNSDGDVVYATLRGLESRPALYDAMAAGNAKAIAAWHRVLRDRAVLGKVQARLFALLTAASKGGTALCLAMYNGHGDAIRAYHAILADPAIVRHIKRALPSLLGAYSGTNVPGLLFAMEKGHADAVTAYHAMLADDAILPHIVDALPELTIARASSGTSALVQAMLFNRSQAIKAFHALLADPAILPHITRSLYPLVTGTRPDGDPALFKAMQRNNAGAIEAFHALLTDPVLLPHVKSALRKLVRAKGEDGTTGLLLALDQGHTDAIRAYHRLLVDPAVLPRIARVLPAMLAARATSGTPGFALALQNGHAQAIRAFHVILADPAVVPHIAHVLPQLVQAKRADGIPGLALALCRGYTRAVLAYRDLLADARVLPHIRLALSDLLAARDSSGTRALVLANRQGLRHSVQAFLLTLEEPAIAEQLGDRLAELRSVRDANELACADDATAATSSSFAEGLSRPFQLSPLRQFFRRLMSMASG